MNWLSRYRETVFFIGMVFVFFMVGVFLSSRKNDIVENGRFTRAFIYDCQVSKSGFFMNIQYSIYGKVYEQELRPNGKCGAIGSYCFIKFKLDNPEDIVFMRDLTFPDCLNSFPIPDSGWVKIPDCP